MIKIDERKTIRVLRVLEYSADSIEAINSILEHNYGYDEYEYDLLKNPINGIMGGGAVIATCDPMSIKFIDGKYRLMRYLEYRSNGDIYKQLTGLDRIMQTLTQSKVPYKGEKLIKENGYEVLIRSGIIGNGFGETIEEVEE